MLPPRSLPLFLATAAVTGAAEPLAWEKLAPLPDEHGVAGAYAGTTGGALLVAGGANFPRGFVPGGAGKTWHDTVWILPSPTGQWITAGKLPRPLGYGVSVTHGGSVVCAGGSDAAGHHADVFRLTWKDGALATQTLPALPTPLALAAGALVGDTLVISGGCAQPGEKAASADTWALDLAEPAATWRKLAPLPSDARFLATAAADDGHFYLFGGASLAPDGGKTKRVYRRDAWKFSLKGNKWRQLADAPAPVVAAPSPAPWLGRAFHVIGGDDGSLVGFAPVEKHPGFPGAIFAYAPAENSWTTPGRTPAPRATAPTAEWQGAWIIPSGEVRPGLRSPDVWRLTPAAPQKKP